MTVSRITKEIDSGYLTQLLFASYRCVHINRTAPEILVTKSSRANGFVVAG